MARVTVEDCLEYVANRFELVKVASGRARQLMRGAQPKVAWDGDKPTVVALREIAEGYTSFPNEVYDFAAQFAAMHESSQATPTDSSHHSGQASQE